MVCLPPIFTSQGKTEWSHLYISWAMSDVTTRRSVIASVVIQSAFSLVLRSHFWFWSWSGMEGNNQQSTNIHISRYNWWVVPSLCCLSWACFNHYRLCHCLLVGYPIYKFLLVFKSHLVLLASTWQGRIVGIPQTFTSQGITAKVATTSRRIVFASLVVQVPWFSRATWFFCHDNDMEE